MTDMSRATAGLGMAYRAGATAVALMVLTSVHHAYGAYAFDTPWRLHIIYVAVPVALAIVSLLSVAGSAASPRLSTASLLLALAVMLVFPAAMIGLYEGGFNHAVKNAVYFFVGEDAARTLFPGDTYEMPKDLLFEATGIAQLPLGWFTIVFCVRSLQARPWR